MKNENIRIKETVFLMTRLQFVNTRVNTIHNVSLIFAFIIYLIYLIYLNG